MRTSEILTTFKNLKKDFEKLENWFYYIYMVLNPHNWEFMSFGKTNKNDVFTCHEIGLKKTATRKLLGITIDGYLSFNEHISDVYKSATRKLNALLIVSCLLNQKQEKIVSNSFISGQFSYCPLIWMFSSISSYEKINKLHERSLQLCYNYYTLSFDEFNEGLVNIHMRNIQQLTIEVFKYLKVCLPLL